MKPFNSKEAVIGCRVVAFGEPGKYHSHIPEAAEDSRVIVLTDSGHVHTFSETGRYSMDLNDRELFFAEDHDPVDPSPGNVDKLRSSQVGDGYRIPAHDEKPDTRAERWQDHRAEWRGRVAVEAPYDRTLTYRVPNAPLPMVPLSPEDLVGKPVMARQAGSSEVLECLSRSPIDVYIACFGPVSWIALQSNYEISFDHGLTWQRAEKPAGGTK